MRFVSLPLLCVVMACSGNGPGPGDSGSGSAVLDVTRSSLVVDLASAVADGTSDVHLTATLIDTEGNPVRNAVVRFQVTGTGNFLSDQALTGPDGIGSTVLHSTKAEAKIITASAQLRDATTPLTQSVSVTFVAGPPEGVRFKTQPGNTRAGIAISPAIELEMLDRNNNLATGDGGTALLRITRSNGGTLSNGGTRTAVNGVIVFDNLIINRPQTGYALRAEAVGGGADESVQFDVVLGDLSAATSTFTPMPVNVVADGTSISTLTLTARDTGGNTLANQAVTLTVSGTGSTLGASSGMTDSGGVFSTSLSATTMGIRTITATIGTASLNTTVTFIQ